MDNNLEISIRTKEKFEFYFLALIFTLLSLTIQTAKVSDNTVQWALEYVGWALFLLSGLAGLMRMEQIPVVFRYFHHQNEENYLLDELKKVPENTKAIDSITKKTLAKDYVEKSILVKEKKVERYQELINEVNKKTSTAYTIQKWAFVVGIIVIMLSRAYYSYLDANNI